MNQTSSSRARRLGLLGIAGLVAAAWALTQLGPGISGTVSASAGRSSSGSVSQGVGNAPAGNAPAGNTPAVAGRPDGVPAGSRFAASSDRFELVGALDGRKLTLWLDRFADNAPVADASLELEIGAYRLVAKPVDDRYEAEFPQPPPPGTWPVTATVIVGSDDDLLAADLVVPPTTTGGAR